MTPFYEKARSLWQSVQNAQILKGLKKYPEPFNPHSWTPDELLNHALEETVDLTHYLVGLKELLDAKDKEIERLKGIIESDKRIKKLLSSTGTYNKPKKSPFEEQELYGSLPAKSMENVPPYFDPDDQ